MKQDISIADFIHPASIIYGFAASVVRSGAYSEPFTQLSNETFGETAKSVLDLAEAMFSEYMDRCKYFYND